MNDTLKKELEDVFLKMSAEIPPHLLLLINKLTKTGKQFIKEYEKSNKKMSDIAKELKAISKEVKLTHEGTNVFRVLGAVGVAGGLAVALYAAFSNEATAARAAVAGGSVALCSGFGIIGTNVTKLVIEQVSVEKVEALGRDFLKMTESQKTHIENIMVVSKEFEQNSSALTTTTKVLAKKLLKAETLEQVLKEVAAVGEQGRQAIDATRNMMRELRELLNFIASITRVTFTTKEDMKLQKCLKQTAELCEKTVVRFEKLRVALKDFENMSL